MIIIARQGRYADYYFAVTNLEIVALREYHALIESRLPAFIEEFEVAHDEVTSADDVRGMLARWQVEAMMPSVLRNPLLISLWAIYESALVEIGVTLQNHRGLGYSLLTNTHELPQGLDASFIKKWDKKKDLFSRAKLYFEGELGFSLYPSPAAERDMRALNSLRNTLAHANGRKGAQSSTKWDELSRLFKAKAGIDMSNGGVTVEAGFVQQQIDVVQNVVSHLITQARDELHRLGVRS